MKPTEIKELSEQECRDAFKEIREKNSVCCKKCDSTEHNWLQSKEQWQCKSCAFRTTLRSGTVMQNSNLPFKEWLLAISFMCEHNGLISANRLKRLMNKTCYETVWRLCHKLRTLMNISDLRRLFRSWSGHEKAIDFMSIKQSFTKERFSGKKKFFSRRDFQGKVEFLERAINIFYASDMKCVDDSSPDGRGVLEETLRQIGRIHFSVSFKHLQNYLSWLTYLRNVSSSGDDLMDSIWMRMPEYINPTRSSGIITDNSEVLN